MDIIVDIDQAMTRLNCSRRTLRRKAAAGEIERATDKAGRVRYKLPARTSLDKMANLTSPGQAQDNYPVLLSQYKQNADLCRQLQKDLARSKKKTFRFKVCLATALITSVLLGSGILLLVGLYRGQLGHLDQADHLLSTVQIQLTEQRGRTAKAEGRADALEQERQELSREVIGLLKKNRFPAGTGFPEPDFWQPLQIPLRPLD